MIKLCRRNICISSTKFLQFTIKNKTKKGINIRQTDIYTFNFGVIVPGTGIEPVRTYVHRIFVPLQLSLPLPNCSFGVWTFSLPCYEIHNLGTACQVSTPSNSFLKRLGSGLPSAKLLRLPRI